MAMTFKNVSHNRSYRPLKFEDLKIGDIFFSKNPSDDDGWCMKVAESCDYEGCIDTNAIVLDSGASVMFPENTNVAKLVKDLTIEYTDKDLLEWI